MILRSAVEETERFGNLFKMTQGWQGQDSNPGLLGPQSPVSAVPEIHSHM